ncbi:hypothetical protein SprV_0200758800 [Sparganum proliferum]
MRVRSRQPPAPSPAFGLHDHVFTPDPDAEGRVCVIITQETILGLTHSLRHVSTSDPRGGRALLTDEPDTCAQDSTSKFQGPPCLSPQTPNNAFSQFKYGTVKPPLLVLNISEAARVGHHSLHLPLAKDLDAPPFNVQRYEPDKATFPEKTFELKTPKRELQPSSGLGVGGDISSQESLKITGLDLLLIGPLDRETEPSYEFQIFAVDGGLNTPLTGTLSVRIHVTDANDNAPTFERSTYEKSVKEGETGIEILQVHAVDRDEGANARIRYRWLPDYDRFGVDIDLLEREELTDLELRRLGQQMTPDRLIQLQELPNYWFRLDPLTGSIFVHRPLDYETKPGFVYHIVAVNPSPPTRDGFDQNTDMSKPSKNSPSTTKVIIHVVNLNDENPQITIDYVSNEDVKHKRIMENGEIGHFIAFIRVTDADAGYLKSPGHADDPYLIESSSLSFDHTFLTLSDIAGTNDPQGAGHVSCQLISHKENYTLSERPDSPGKEYILSTKTPLDREVDDRQFIEIACYDHGSPQKTSTATVEVEILDQNDCDPEIQVYTIPTTRTGRTLQSPLPRSRLAQILNEFPKSQPTPVDHSLFAAYSAGIPVVPISVLENQLAGVTVVSIRAVDNDAGANGQVNFKIIKEETSFPHISATSPQDHPTGRYPEAELDFSAPHVHIASDIEASDLFQLDPNGDMSARRKIDREEFAALRNELYLLVHAFDHGQPPRSSYVLLAIAIEDENDNPPVFVIPQMQFNVFENEPAPQRIGEIPVYDADMGARLQQEGSFPEKPEDKRLPRVTKPAENYIRLLINPGHGLPELPFAIDAAPNGIFYLNVTRSLDREAEEGFRFSIVASDYGSSPHIRARTTTASVSVNVLDRNDHAPEIIFPRPALPNTNVHKLSFNEPPGYEILSVNANDKDASEENNRFTFELGPTVSSIPGVDPACLAKTAFNRDLFKIDSERGLLQTVRRMTEADIGEHWIQVIVHDTGLPPQETRHTIRLAVDRSAPHFGGRGRSGKAGGVGSYLHEEVPEPVGGSSARHPSAGHLDPLAIDYDGYSWPISVSGVRGNAASDIVLFVIISLVLAIFLVFAGLCIYLRHKQKFCKFLPDVCVLFKRQTSHPYNSPTHVCRKPKDPTREGCDVATSGPGPLIGDTRRSLPSRPIAFSPDGQSKTLFDFPDRQQQSQQILKCSTQAFPHSSIFGPRFQTEMQFGVPRILDCTDYLEKPKFYTEYYQMGVSSASQNQQNNRLPPPNATFRPIVPANEILSNGNTYHSAAVKQSTTSPTDRPSVVHGGIHSLCSRDRCLGEAAGIPLYVQEDGRTDPHHYQSLSATNASAFRLPGNIAAQTDPKRSGGRGATQLDVVPSNFLDFASMSSPGQGSCDFILMESAEAAPTTTLTNALEKAETSALSSSRFKSEPSLVLTRSQSPPVPEDTDGDWKATHWKEDSPTHGFKAWRLFARPQGDDVFAQEPRRFRPSALQPSSTIVNNRGKTSLVVEDPLHFDNRTEQPENYAVSFPRLQASFV